MLRRIALAGSMLVLVACGPGVASTPAGPSVPWADYASGLQSRIDQLRDAKDCTGLQDEFDIADANGAATMTRTGHNNADLMRYIDVQMRAAGCY